MYNITFSVLIKLNLIRIRICVVNCVDLRFCCCVLWGFLGNFFLFLCTLFNTASSMPPLRFPASEDARFEPRTVTTLALTVQRSNHSARSHHVHVFYFWIHRKSQSYRFEEYNLEKFSSLQVNFFSQETEAESEEKHGVWDPTPELTIT